MGLPVVSAERRAAAAAAGKSSRPSSRSGPGPAEDGGDAENC